MSALKSHMATRHSYVSPYRLRVDTPWCPCCLLYLHSLARVLKHLTTSATCGHNVMKYVPTVDIHAAGGVGHGMLGKKDLVVKGTLCVRAVGPLMPIFDCNEQLIVSSGHPLGKSHQSHLPSLSFDADLSIAIQDAIDMGECPASFYRPCSSECLMCISRISLS